MSERPAKADCPVCHQEVTVRVDGTLRLHGYRYGTGGGCAGSGTIIWDTPRT